jgi:propionate catabolism regulator PrpR
LSIGMGDLAEAAGVVREFIKEGTEVIISRGGTARYIEKHFDVPVVHIAVSGFDLIRSLAEAKRYGNKIGVIGFRDVIYGSKSLESVLDVQITEIEISSSEKVPEALERAFQAGIKVIVGDSVSARHSTELGIKTILVNSGKESLSLAVKEANELALVRRKERAHSEQIKVILDSLHEGVIAIDAESKIGLINRAAEQMLKVEKDRVLGKSTGEVLPGFPLEKVYQNGQSVVGSVHRVGNELLVQNTMPVTIDTETVGAVATLADARYFQTVEAKIRQKTMLKGHVAQHTFNDIISKNHDMLKLIEKARQFAQTEATVLINGETGTGKELFAQGIHNASLRKKGPFVAINCAALPENLLESELFGYEEGAFTGARKGGKNGLFELAHRGTLFLDEIGELSLNLQARLLRVLQQKVIMRVGGDEVIPVDVRIIAATHKDLKREIEKEKFREDLYYRINVLHVSIPPLRDRLEDIPLLISSFIKKASQGLKNVPPQITEQAGNMLQLYHWPGNIRELENVIERLVILSGGTEINGELVGEILEIPENRRGISPSPRVSLTLNGSIKNLEKEVITKTLELTNYNKDETCRLLGLSKTTLWRRLK